MLKSWGVRLASVPFGSKILATSHSKFICHLRLFPFQAGLSGGWSGPCRGASSSSSSSSWSMRPRPTNRAAAWGWPASSGCSPGTCCPLESSSSSSLTLRWRRFTICIESVPARFGSESVRFLIYVLEATAVCLFVQYNASYGLSTEFRSIWPKYVPRFYLLHGLLTCLWGRRYSPCSRQPLTSSVDIFIYLYVHLSSTINLLQVHLLLTAPYEFCQQSSRVQVLDQGVSTYLLFVFAVGEEGRRGGGEKGAEGWSWTQGTAWPVIS